MNLLYASYTYEKIWKNLGSYTGGEMTFIFNQCIRPLEDDFRLTIHKLSENMCSEKYMVWLMKNENASFFRNLSFKLGRGSDQVLGHSDSTVDYCGHN